MSVTFSIEGNFTGMFDVVCWDETAGDMTVRNTTPFDGYEAAVAGLIAHRADHGCQVGDSFTHARMDVSDEFDVNVNNGNAGILLGRLGIDVSEDRCGRMAADEFQGSVLLAMAQEQVSIPAYTTGGVGTGAPRWTDCGTTAGYFDFRLVQLHTLAAEAVRLGRDVVWS